MALLVVISWYTVGFIAAAHLVRRGHDRTVWTVAAAIVGAVVALAAVAMAVWRGLRTPSSLVQAAPPEIAVVVDEDPAPSMAALARLDPMPSSVTLVALASHEATAAWVDTGELAEVRFRLSAHRMRSPLPTEEAVVNGAPDALAEVGARLIVLPRDRRHRSRRHDAWRVLSAARASGAAVLSPAATASRVPVRSATTADNRKAMA